MEFSMAQHQRGNGDGTRSPTYKPPQPSGLTPVLERNITALYARRQREAEAASWEERAADAMTRFTGSMIFVYLHLLILACGSLPTFTGYPASPLGMNRLLSWLWWRP